MIIGLSVSQSVGLGFHNEFRAERAVEALHSQIRHRAVVRRGDAFTDIDVTQVVMGDVVRLELGANVPADVRIVEATGLECDESVLTGESMPSSKQTAPVAPDSGLADLCSIAFMGTVTRSGEGSGVVIATGASTVFGGIAAGLGGRHGETEFQKGLRKFSGLLVRVAAILSVAILIINLILRRPAIDAVLFSLAIAVGITPQLLPAVVTTSLATGSRRLAQRGVLVKRLVCIEDLGDIEVLFTDKTGTLTEGRITFERAIDPDGQSSSMALLCGLACREGSLEDGELVGANPLDTALWAANTEEESQAIAMSIVAVLPFDHDRRMLSVLVDDPIQNDRDGRSGRARTKLDGSSPKARRKRCWIVASTYRRVPPRPSIASLPKADGLSPWRSDRPRT